MFQAVYSIQKCHMSYEYALGQHASEHAMLKGLTSKIYFKLC